MRKLIYGVLIAHYSTRPAVSTQGGGGGGVGERGGGKGYRKHNLLSDNHYTSLP